MTDQRTLKKIIDEQRKEIEALKERMEQAKKILSVADFEDLTGAHKIFWTAWQDLMCLLDYQQEKEKI